MIAPLLCLVKILSLQECVAFVAIHNAESYFKDSIALFAFDSIADTLLTRCVLWLYPIILTIQTQNNLTKISLTNPLIKHDSYTCCKV